MFAVHSYSRPSQLSTAAAVLDSIMNSHAAAASLPSDAPSEVPTHSPRIEVTERDDAYELRAELPGVLREQIKVAVEARRVTIKTEAVNIDASLSSGTLIYSEGIAKQFARTVTLPLPLNADQVVAKLENGVLTLTLPKLAAAQLKHVTVN